RHGHALQTIQLAVDDDLVDDGRRHAARPSGAAHYRGDGGAYGATRPANLAIHSVTPAVQARMLTTRPIDQYAATPPMTYNAGTRAARNCGREAKARYNP